MPPGTVPDREVAQGEQLHDLEEASEEAARAQEHRGQFDRSWTEMIRGYAEVHACRREYLLNYFGEEFDDPCGYCDNCEAGVVVEGIKGNKLFPLNGRVVYEKWGKGLVQRYEDTRMVILFDGVGGKTLDTELVISAVCSKLRSKKTKEQARMRLTVQVLRNRRLKSSGTVLFR